MRKGKFNHINATNTLSETTFRVPDPIIERMVGNSTVMVNTQTVRLMISFFAELHESITNKICGTVIA